MSVTISGTTGIDAGSLPVANTGKISAGSGLPVVLNTAGVDRVTVDTSGNVGIGTSSPISKLSISGYLNSQDSNNNGALYLGQYLNGNGAYGGFEWNNTAGILGLRTQGAYPITFATNNTERVRLDANGNVGIGTSSPIYALDVKSSKAGEQTLRVQNDNTADGSLAQIRVIGNNNTSEIDIRSWSINSTGTRAGIAKAGLKEISDNSTLSDTNGLLIVTDQAKPIYFATANTERMRISSNGYITTPSQPSFNVYTASAAGGQDISFASVRHNRGNCWNTSTNTFTAPVAGSYQFQFAFLHNTSSNSYCRVLFKVNGNIDTRYGDTLQSNPPGSFNASSASVTLYLQTNDTVKLFNEQSAIYGPDYGAFSGYLIG